jgi:hypothetical protein
MGGHLTNYLLFKMWKGVFTVCITVLWLYLSGGSQEIISQSVLQESNPEPLKYEAEMNLMISIDIFHFMIQNNTTHDAAA